MRLTRWEAFNILRRRCRRHCCQFNKSRRQIEEWKGGREKLVYVERRQKVEDATRTKNDENLDERRFLNTSSQTH